MRNLNEYINKLFEESLRTGGKSNSDHHNSNRLYEDFLISLIRASATAFSIVEFISKRLIRNKSTRTLKELGLLENLDKEVSLFSDERLTDKGYTRASYPFKMIPNAKSFEISLRPYDWLYAAFGIKKRFKPMLSFKKYSNLPMNRYIEHQNRRLCKAIESKDFNLYGRISLACIKRSNVFFITQLRHMELNGHRTMKLSEVIRIYKHYKRIAHNMSVDLDYRRVFIPKKSNQLRPLGVPSKPGRIYLGLGNKFAMKLLENQINKQQHAYISGRGTMTAGRDISRKLRTCDAIYEFDLSRFFDTVKLSVVKKAMLKRGFTKDIAEYIMKVNSRMPYGIYFLSGESLTDQQCYQLGIDPSRKEEIQEYSENYQYEQLRRDRLGYGERTCGVAQGVPLSPLLSLLVLEETLFKEFGENLVMYADDGLIFIDHKRPLSKDQKGLLEGGPTGAGFSINKSKSRYVLKSTKEGEKVGLHPLKFLGLEYDGNLMEFRAHTRNGSRLLYDKHELLDLVVSRELENYTNKPKDTQDYKTNVESLFALMKSKCWGLIQSRLYQGTGNLKEFSQNFEVTFNKGSGLSTKKERISCGKLDIFNSTSYACRALMFILKKVKPNLKKDLLKGAVMLPQTYNVDELAQSIQEVGDKQQHSRGVEEIEGVIDEGKLFNGGDQGKANSIEQDELPNSLDSITYPDKVTYDSFFKTLTYSDQYKTYYKPEKFETQQCIEERVKVNKEILAKAKAKVVKEDKR